MELMKLFCTFVFFPQGVDSSHFCICHSSVFDLSEIFHKSSNVDNLSVSIILWALYLSVGLFYCKLI